jgi:WD40 repeat protein
MIRSLMPESTSRRRLQPCVGAPEQLGPYRLLGVLGRGGMGDVYLAYDTALCRQVALKVLPPELARDRDFVRRFHAEAAAVAGLEHPNVVLIYRQGQEGEHHYFAMQYVAGESLDRRLARRKRLSADETMAILDDCLAGLQAAHAAGLVHRDIKPSNILLDTRGPSPRALLADFGLVKGPAVGSLRTATGVVLGTAEYMAPEQGQGLAVDGRADLYALGVVAYQLLSGRLPFEGESATDLIFRHIYEAPPPLAERAPDAPPPLVALVHRLLAKGPDNRFPTCADARTALAACRCPASSLPADPEKGICLSTPTVVWVPAPSADLGHTMADAERGIAGLEERSEELADLIAEGEAVVAELTGQARQCRKDADPEGERLAEALEAEAQAHAARLAPLRAEQERVAAEAGRLRHQHDLLRARLVVADGSRSAPSPRWKPRARLVVLLASVVGALALTVVLAVLVRSWLLRPLEVPELARRFSGHRGPVRCVAFSPDGTRALSVSGSPDGDRTLRLWDVKTGEEVLCLEGHTEAVHFVAFSPNGQQALSSSHDGTVRLWDLNDGRQLLLLREPGSGGTNRVAFSPDGRLAAVACDDHLVRLWSLASGRVARHFRGHTGRVTGVAFHPDGKTILSASWDGSVRFWDVVSGEEIRQFRGHRGLGGKDPTGPVWEVAVLPDGEQVLSGGDDGTVRLWDLATGQEVRCFVGHTLQVFGLAVSRDGRVVLSASGDGTARLWEVATGRELHCYRVSNEVVWSVALSPDGQYALTGGGGGVLHDKWLPGIDWDVYLWRLPRPGLTLAPTPVHPAEPDPLLRTLVGHESWVCNARFIRDGKEIVSSGLDGTVRRWQTESGALIHTLPGHQGHVWGLDVSANEQLVLSGTAHTRDGTPLRLRKLTTGEDVASFAGVQNVSSVAISPDGKSAVLAPGESNDVIWWDLAAARELRRLEGHRKPARCVLFLPDGRHALSGSHDGTIRLWELATGRSLPEFLGHSATVHALALSPDGKRLLSGSWDHTIRLWDVSTGQEEHCYRGHATSVLSVAFSPDGRRLLSGCYNGTVRLWDVETDRPLACFGHNGTAEVVAFSPNGRIALSGGNDKTLRLWRLPLAHSPGP